MNRILLSLFLLTSFPAVAASATSTRLNQAKAWERADANGDGVLSLQEAQRVRRLFRHFDAIDIDHDGVITGGEVNLWRESNRRAAKPKTARGADEIVKFADRDGDGVLSQREFVEALPRFAQRFESIDLDQNRSLDRGELAQWLSGLRAPRRSKQSHQ